AKARRDPGDELFRRRSDQDGVLRPRPLDGAAGHQVPRAADHPHHGRHDRLLHFMARNGALQLLEMVAVAPGEPPQPDPVRRLREWLVVFQSRCSTTAGMTATTSAKARSTPARSAGGLTGCASWPCSGCWAFSTCSRGCAGTAARRCYSTSPRASSTSSG